jgi:hypothetical protein
LGYGQPAATAVSSAPIARSAPIPLDAMAKKVPMPSAPWACLVHGELDSGLAQRHRGRRSGDARPDDQSGAWSGHIFLL